MIRTILITLFSGLLIVPKIIHANGDDTSSTSTPFVSPKITAGTLFNQEDLLLKPGFSLNNRQYGVGLEASFGFRPSYRAVQVKQNDHLTNQYHEQKFLLLLELEKRHWVPIIENNSQIGVGGYLRVGGGYLWGKYRGVQEGLEPSFQFIPSAGLIARIRGYNFIRLGYLYLNDGSTNLSNHRLHLGCSFSF